MWWINDPERLSRERRAIDAIDDGWFENPEWSLNPRCCLRLTFEIALSHSRFRLAMTYHSTFPASPPSVRPACESERISGHQYVVSGELCLSIRSDNWDPDLTGADMVRSAHKLLELEAPNEHGEVAPAPSAHDVPSELELRSAGARFYLDTVAREAFTRSALDGAPIEIGFDSRFQPNILTHVLSIGPHAAAGSTVAAGAPAALRETHLVVPGYFFIVDAPIATIQRIGTVEKFTGLLGNRVPLSTDSSWCCVIRSSDDSIVLVDHTRDREDVRIYKTIEAPVDSPRSELDAAKFSQRRVGIVGLGSLGSRIATSLARAGVGRFELVDGDILHSGNLERHDADWRDVGRHKAELMCHRLRLIHPRVQAHSWLTALGAQVPSAEAGNVLASLAACDLLIDATANPDVFNHLALIAVRSHRTLVWGAVYGGALGGEIGRSRPDKDPSPYDIRQCMTQAYGTADGPPPLPTGRGYNGSIGEETPLIANDAETSAIAAHIAAYAIDALVGSEPSIYPAPAYFIGLKRGWLFDGPFDTRPLLVDAPARTVPAGADAGTLDTDFLRSLVETLQRDSQGTKTND